MTRRTGNAAGFSALVLLLLFWAFVLKAPGLLDRLLRPYGLPILFGVLLVAIGLTVFATIRGSR